MSRVICEGDYVSTPHGTGRVTNVNRRVDNSTMLLVAIEGTTRFCLEQNATLLNIDTDS